MTEFQSSGWPLVLSVPHEPSVPDNECSTFTHAKGWAQNSMGSPHNPMEISSPFEGYGDQSSARSASCPWIHNMSKNYQCKGTVASLNPWTTSSTSMLLGGEHHLPGSWEESRHLSLRNTAGARGPQILRRDM